MDMIDQKQFDELARPYLQLEHWEDEKLRVGAAALTFWAGERADADVISTVFRCSASAAARARDQVEKQFGPSGYVSVALETNVTDG
jgi:hypothetical protein